MMLKAMQVQLVVTTNGYSKLMVRDYGGPIAAEMTPWTMFSKNLAKFYRNLSADLEEETRRPSNRDTE